jgi:hypothetical protein
MVLLRMRARVALLNRAVSSSGAANEHHTSSLQARGLTFHYLGNASFKYMFISLFKGSRPTDLNVPLAILRNSVLEAENQK